MSKIIAEIPEQTIVAQYIRPDRAGYQYQSEAELEAQFIKDLQAQGYEYREDINDAKTLIENLRVQLEKLNKIRFTDNEWERFSNEFFLSNNLTPKDKTEILQEDSVKVLKRDNGDEVNIRIIDKSHLHNNIMQVINQFEVSQSKDQAIYDNRYDVTVLCNGIPIVHIELKRRGVGIREAFNQNCRYGKHSFWAAGKGMFEFVQIFVISNGTETKYYSNTTRYKNNTDKTRGKANTSFDFTMYWADRRNNPITDLEDFAITFFNKRNLLQLLFQYCVFTTDKELLVMRPYQIGAVESILHRVLTSTNYHKEGTREAGGYVFHATGSGKTLTSFKAARLLSEIEGLDIEKVFFVVDRQDLDTQTMKEYEKFQKGSVYGSSSTKKLKENIDNRDCNIIVSTIQKLTNYIKANPKAAIYNKHIIIIFDECHRSQFGEMHKLITKAFSKYHIFGFTGTPIYPQNAKKEIYTTKNIFGDCLHTYNLANAIADNKVLPFLVQCIPTMHMKEKVQDEQVKGIDINSLYNSRQRIEMVSKYIMEHFDQMTYQAKSYELLQVKNVVETARSSKEKELKELKRVCGFNSIFAVSSIEVLKKYYLELQRQNQQRAKPLKIATIYSFGSNTDETGIIDSEDIGSAEDLSKSDREFLESAIKEYNKMFGTSYDTTHDKFPNYYKDISQRMKNKEIDILLVVNMFLTGFDAPCLNTLWLDKKLDYHNLLQAMSRTNRIYNEVKKCGNIVSFRDITKNVEEAIALFCDSETAGCILIKTFNDYYQGYVDINKKKHKGYVEVVEDLRTRFPLTTNFNQLTTKAKKEFVQCMNEYLRLANTLRIFDEFKDKSKQILTEREKQDYQGIYQNIKDDFEVARKYGELTDVKDDVVFELELIEPVLIDLEHILNLIAKYHSDNMKDKDLKAAIFRTINAYPELRSKKELLEMFFESITSAKDIDKQWVSFVRKQKEEDLQNIIQKYNLDENKLKNKIQICFELNDFSLLKYEIPRICKASFFAPITSKKINQALIVLEEYFNKYSNIRV